MPGNPVGVTKDKRYAREDFDWYIEPRFTVEQLMSCISFNVGGTPDHIIDVTCGSGNILDVAKARGHSTAGYDIVNRNPAHPLTVGDFLKVERMAMAKDRATSVICNPPYSYIEDIAEKIIRHVCRFPIHRAAFLVPIAFLCSQGRYRFFTRDLKPSHIAYCSDRPTCPPGAKIAEMATPFKGGVGDYVWVIYTRPPKKYRTESIWLTPDKY